MKNNIENLKLSIKSKVGEDNKLFGSVNSTLLKNHLPITILKSIKSLFQLIIQISSRQQNRFLLSSLHRNLIVELNFELFRIESYS